MASQSIRVLDPMALSLMLPLVVIRLVFTDLRREIIRRSNTRPGKLDSATNIDTRNIQRRNNVGSNITIIPLMKDGSYIYMHSLAKNFGF